MRASAKGRYALAAVISMAQQYDNKEYITVIRISEKRGISKIYLKQAFSLLKCGGIVNSVKGAQGGYQLARSPGQISVWDVLSAVETVSGKAPDIDMAMRVSVFEVLDQSIQDTLRQITLDDLITQAEKYKGQSAIERNTYFSKREIAVCAETACPRRA